MGTRRVLIVEDSDTIAAVIERLVERHDGWEIVGRAARGSDVEMLVERLHPDVVTLDLSLSDGDAFDLLERLAMRCGVPVVVVSGSVYEGSPVTSEALARGADACFDKARLSQDVQSFWRVLDDTRRP